MQARADELSIQVKDEPEESALRRTHEHLKHLLSYLKETYGNTLDTLASLLEHGQITFELLWSLFVPGKTTLYALCPITSEPRALRLVHAELCQKADSQAPVSAAYDPTGLLTSKNSQEQQMQYFWRLVVEYVEVDIAAQGDSANDIDNGSSAQPRKDVRPTFGFAGLGRVIDVARFKGAKKISSLVAYPIQYYPGPGGVEGLRERLVKRGKKWAEFAGGMHHVAYRGLAFKFKETSHIKFSVSLALPVHAAVYPDAEMMTGELSDHDRPK